MKVVFLCGGIGKRMFPIMEDKFLLKFLGKPLLQHHIEMALKNGFNDFIIVGNPENIGRIRDIVGKIHESTDIKIETGVQKEPKGMANALLSVKEMILNNGIMVVSPNDVFDDGAYKLMSRYINKDDSSYILSYRVKEYFPGGYIVADQDNNVKRVVEKPGEGNAPSDLVNIVFHLHNSTEKLFHYLRNVKTDKDDVYEVALDNMIKDGCNVKAVPYDGFWKAIKYPWHIFDINEHFMGKMKHSISRNAIISDIAVIKGNVHIEDGVRILENAMIVGPCYIGKNCIIGNNTLVRDFTSIGDRSVVGFSTEIKHSYVGEDCWFHSNYVGDSIIDNQCKFGAGSVTANFRFDEKNVQVKTENEKIDTGRDKFGAIMGHSCETGINSSLMPGVRVGPNSIVGPNVALTENLEPNKIVFVKQDQILEKNVIEMDDNKTTQLMKKLERMR